MPYELEDLGGVIVRFFEEVNPLTLAEMSNIVQPRFENSRNAETLGHIPHCDPQINKCPTHPINERRLQVTDEQVCDDFTHLFETISGVPPHFIFNIEETANQAWADAGEIVCFVPHAVEAEIMYSSLFRT
jgi:hypothetical protein